MKRTPRPSVHARTMPMVTSRPLSRFPNAPMATPAPSEREQADDRIEREDHGAGRAREADVRQRVSRESGSPQDDEVADRPGDDRDDRARLEGVDHELVAEQITHVGG